MFRLLLAFIGGGITEALIAHAAHHFFPTKPVKVAVINAADFDAARRDPRVRQLWAEADAYLADQVRDP